MNGISSLIGLSAGTALGIFFYGGLWITVRRLPSANHPALLALGSFWLRSLVALAGFLLLAKARWQYAAIALLGFTLGRIAISRSLREPRTGKCT